MATLTGNGLANFAKGKKGTPYIYGCKGADGAVTQKRVNMLASMYPSVFTAKYLNKIKTRKYIGKVCTDCSGLISWYTGKVYGSSQLYSKAYARLPMSRVNDFAVGTVLWKKGHVGVYLGDGLVAEAKGIDYPFPKLFGRLADEILLKYNLEVVTVIVIPQIQIE